jgi:hypothetical protein
MIVFYEDGVSQNTGYFGVWAPWLGSRNGFRGPRPEAFSEVFLRKG